MQDLVLRGFDQECREFVQQQYGVHGMKMHSENSPSKIEKSGGKLRVTFEPKKGDKWSLDGVDIVLMATGRNPITKGIGLESVCTVSHAPDCISLVPLYSYSAKPHSLFFQEHACRHHLQYETPPPPPPPPRRKLFSTSNWATGQLVSMSYMLSRFC